MTPSDSRVVVTVNRQINITCNRNNSGRGCNGCRVSCGFIAITILITLFTLTIGLIIGAAIADTILGALAALIVLAVVLFVLTLIRVMMCICEGRRE